MDESSRYSGVFDYLHNSCYPTGSGIKRGIWQTAALLELKEGVLYLKTTKRQWIMCTRQQEQIISSCHDDSLGSFTCHYGWGKTVDKVCTCYYWASVLKDIKAYVGSCEVCQKCNLKLQKQASKLQPI